METWNCGMLSREQKLSLKHTVRQAQKASWCSFVTNLNTNTSSAQIWKQIRILSWGPSTKTFILKHGDEIISSPSDIAETIVGHFAGKGNGVTENQVFENHKALSEETGNFFGGEGADLWYNRPFTISELQLALKTCSFRSPGPDTIPYSFIHNFKTEHLDALLSFYIYVYRTGMPPQCQEVCIIPIIKFGKPSNLPNSYRPISLTNCLCKILEKLVNRRLQALLEYKSTFIVGTLKCTPTIKLEAEADVKPLAIQHSKLLLQYGRRVLGVGNQPVRQLILEYFPIQDVLN